MWWDREGVWCGKAVGYFSGREINIAGLCWSVCFVCVRDRMNSLSLCQCMFVYSPFPCAGIYSNNWKVWQRHISSHPSLQFISPFLSSVFPSASSFLPLHSPVTWYSYNPLRHVLIFWLSFFRFLLAVECWLSPTHTFPLSKSLSPSISTSPQEKERVEELLYDLLFPWQPLCWSAVYLLSLFVCSSVYLWWYVTRVCVLLLLLFFAGVYTSIWAHVLSDGE